MESAGAERLSISKLGCRLGCRNGNALAAVQARNKLGEVGYMFGDFCEGI